MQRWLAVATAVVGLGAGLLKGDDAAPRRGGEERTQPASATPGLVRIVTFAPGDERIHEALSEPVDLEFVDIPLQEALSFLGSAHEISILLDTTALEEAHIATDEPINLILSGVSLRSALNVILEPLGLDYHVADEVLKVSTAEKARKALDLRIYDLRAISPQPSRLASELQALLPEVIEPETWKAGGGRGVAMRLGDWLVVAQTRQVQQKVERFLSELAELPAFSPGDEPRTPEPANELPAPVPAEARAADPSDGLTITIRPDGTPVVNGTAYDERELTKLLRLTAHLETNRRAVIRASSDANFQDVMQVLSLCEKAGLECRFQSPADVEK